MNQWQRMPMWQKVALGVFLTSYTAQTIGGLVVLKHCEEVERQHKAAWLAGRYLLSIIEREGYEMTEFDGLAIEALKPDPPKKKK